MASDVSADLRAEVARRAGYRCEYCLVREADTGFADQVDHIVSRKHGGLSSADNLAYVCMLCNRYKGADVASVDLLTERLVRLFHPRRDLMGRSFPAGRRIHRASFGDRPRDSGAAASEYGGENCRATLTSKTGKLSHPLKAIQPRPLSPPRNTRSNSITTSVSPTRSEGVENFVADFAKTRQVTAADFEKEFFRSIRPTSIIQRFATRDEVAALVVFVASALSSATNGAALRAEGGVVRSIL